MVRFFRNCIYQGKYLFRDKGMLFWTLLYPIIMAVFFFTSFNGIIQMEMGDIDVGIGLNSGLKPIFENIDLINLHEIKEDEIEDKLVGEEIKVYIKEDMNLLVDKSGLEQTVVKEIVDQIKQMQNMNIPMENFDFSTDYISDNNQKSEGIIVIFYSLIAMVSTYGFSAGIEIVSAMQANLSNVGKRLNISPLKKQDFLLSGISVSFGINILANILLILFIKYGLKLELFTEIKYTSIFILLGNLFGVALGIFIGASNKQTVNTKTLLGIAITLFLSFLSGMMSVDIKVLIDEKYPILGRLNPISIVTNNLYKINLLGNTNTAMEGIVILSTFSIILILGSYSFLRRKSYDSI